MPCGSPHFLEIPAQARHLRWVIDHLRQRSLHPPVLLAQGRESRFGRQISQTGKEARRGFQGSDAAKVFFTRKCGKQDTCEPYATLDSLRVSTEPEQIVGNAAGQ